MRTNAFVHAEHHHALNECRKQELQYKYGIQSHQTEFRVKAVIACTPGLSATLGGLGRLQARQHTRVCHAGQNHKADTSYCKEQSADMLQALLRTVSATSKLAASRDGTAVHASNAQLSTAL